MHFFSIDTTAFEILNYPISYVELIATLFGLASVYFATKANILTWGTGIINELFLFILFFQVQLYADMFLQVFFFIVTLYGWYNWKKMPKKDSITTIPIHLRMGLFAVILVSTMVMGYLFSTIHTLLPQFFTIEASYPYVDSFVMVLSVAATFLLANKKIETWFLWITVDVVCVFLFFKKEIYFLGLEYLIFLGLASFGLINWRKQMSNG